MQRFAHILVVASDDDTTRDLLRSAVELAHRNGATITLFDVLESTRSRSLNLGGRIVDLGAEMQSERLEQLGALAEEVNVPVRVDAALGTAYIEIIRRVVAHGHDLVMVAPDAVQIRAGLAGASTTMHLLRKCPVPVWVGRPGHDLHGVAVSIGPLDDPTPSTLTITLLQLASSLAASRHTDLHVIHAWRLEGESLLRGARIDLTGPEVDRLAAFARSEAETRVRQAIDDVASDVPTRVHLRKGDPGKVIADVVGELRPEILVMGTLARTGIPGAIIGNTAERLLGTIETSVLAAKPEGFTSPVAS
jgi:universal stress protein E